MRLSSRIIKIVAVIVTVLLALTAFIAYPLTGISTSPIVFSAPPPFVKQYADAFSPDNNKSLPNSIQQTSAESNRKSSGKLTEDFEIEKQIIMKVFFEDEPFEVIFDVLTHSDRAQRVRMASAFAAVNSEFTHDEESGFAEKREQFWQDAAEYLPHLQNALFEALIVSAEEQTWTPIPYTLAWMPGQDLKTLEMLVWAAENHHDTWVRWFSIYFVTEFGGNDALSDKLIASKIHDPDFGVRKEALNQRIRSLIGIRIWSV